MLCQCLLYNRVNHLYVHIYPLPLGPPSQPTPIPPFWVITEHGAELPAPYSSFPSAIYCTHAVYICTNPNPPVPPTLPFPTCPHVHSLHLCIYSCPAHTFICTNFFGFHMYTLIFIFLFMTYFTTYDSLQFYSCLSKSPVLFLFYG